MRHAGLQRQRLRGERGDPVVAQMGLRPVLMPRDFQLDVFLFLRT
ncbi:hypothetical protein GALL_445710 [mine drainage metagenome]|uniref:Uncharacterized protein n=1 Tax=mine drainage metagenome TaxID=410659 RepID=A0A1J5PQK6_9ZZZZ